MTLAQFCDPELDAIERQLSGPEPRYPLMLIVDTSSSMEGEALSALNNGLERFYSEIAADPILSDRVELALISYGPAQVHVPFQPVSQFTLPTLQANGRASLGEAVSLGLDLVAAREEELSLENVYSSQPWVFLLSHSAPCDEWQLAAWQVEDLEKQGALSFFAVDLGGQNLSLLEQVSVRRPFALDSYRFSDLFSWLHEGLGALCWAEPGDAIALKNPAADGGWAKSTSA